jgi:hypothetical protein
MDAAIHKQLHVCATISEHSQVRSNIPIHMMAPPYYNITEIGNIARTNGERPRWSTKVRCSITFSPMMHSSRAITLQYSNIFLKWAKGTQWGHRDDTKRRNSGFTLESSMSTLEWQRSTYTIFSLFNHFNQQIGEVVRFHAITMALVFIWKVYEQAVHSYNQLQHAFTFGWFPSFIEMFSKYLAPVESYGKTYWFFCS